MALYVVRHQHAPEECPAGDPELGARLLNHLSRPSARRHGIEIRGEAVVQGEHTLLLIVEADDERALREFMEPFSRAGSVDLLPASTCARVMANGGCAAPSPGLDDSVPAVDPEDACQRAIEAGLVVHRAHPLNGETSIPALVGGVVMPNAHFYVRNHFQIPALDAATWRLEVGGLVERPLSLSLRDLKNLPSHTVVVTLECAGNGRSRLDPPVDGEPWDLGAVSTAEWTGVPLSEVLDRAGVRPEGCDVVLRGSDRGTVDGRPEPINFERSLSVDEARASGALLAYAMNGEPLPVQHGFPLRVVVPGWYAVTSVKWLREIELVDAPFHAYYQGDKYVYEWPEGDGVRVEPVTRLRVRALITEPGAGDELAAGDVAIRGVAWSGVAPIAKVEVRVGDGVWQDARLVGEPSRSSWQWWELLTRLDQRGPVVLRSRATDEAGRTQPDRPEWNRLGYGNNVVHDVAIQVA